MNRFMEDLAQWLMMSQSLALAPPNKNQNLLLRKFNKSNKNQANLSSKWQKFLNQLKMHKKMQSRKL